MADVRKRYRTPRTRRGGERTMYRIWGSSRVIIRGRMISVAINRNRPPAMGRTAIRAFRIRDVCEKERDRGEIEAKRLCRLMAPTVRLRRAGSAEPKHAIASPVAKTKDSCEWGSAQKTTDIRTNDTRRESACSEKLKAHVTARR